MAFLEVKATFDWSNLDIFNFQYFKYPPPTIRESIFVQKHGRIYELRNLPPQKPGPIKDGINRAKAIYKYLKAVVAGNPEHEIKTRFEFDPEFGQRWSDSYQKTNGFRGEKLVEDLGNGKIKDFH